MAISALRILFASNREPKAAQEGMSCALQVSGLPFAFHRHALFDVLGFRTIRHAARLLHPG